MRHKPSSVPWRGGRPARAKTIYLGRALRRGSPPYGGSGLPAVSTRTMSPQLGLAPGGVYHAVPLTRDAVRSYRTFSPLPFDKSQGGMFSVALSLSVTRYQPGCERWALPITTVRRCSDFPPPKQNSGAVFHASGVPRLYNNPEGCPLFSAGFRPGLSPSGCHASVRRSMSSPLPLLFSRLHRCLVFLLQVVFAKFAAKLFFEGDEFRCNGSPPSL